MNELRLRVAELADAAALINAYQRSAIDLAPWTYQPDDMESHIAGQKVYLLCERLMPNVILGSFSISGIMRGSFQSAYLGYCAFTPYQGKGYMRSGMELLLLEAFGNLKLHRLEANIQQENNRSIKFVQAAGFHKEGFSPQYLRINGVWRDHERWAIINTNWQE